MEEESVRLNSFQTWPADNVVSANEMAYAGFYYTQLCDYVKCAFCSIEIGGWVAGSDAMSEHKKHSPNCKFICERIEQPLEPLSATQLTIFSFKSHYDSNVVDNYNYDDIDRVSDEDNCSKNDDGGGKYDTNNNFNCAVCLESYRQILFEPCRHVVCCEECAAMVSNCVVCRQLIQSRIKIFLH